MPHASERLGKTIANLGYLGSHIGDAELLNAFGQLRRGVQEDVYDLDQAIGKINEQLAGMDYLILPDMTPQKVRFLNQNGWVESNGTKVTPLPYQPVLYSIARGSKQHWFLGYAMHLPRVQGPDYVHSCALMRLAELTAETGE